MPTSPSTVASSIVRGRHDEVERERPIAAQAFRRDPTQCVGLAALLRHACPALDLLVMPCIDQRAGIVRAPGP